MPSSDRATAAPWWYEQAQRAFDWFLGWNDLGLELYAQETGGCRDGLRPGRSNENQGAESLLAFLLSLAEMRLVQSTATGGDGSPRDPLKLFDVRRSDGAPVMNPPATAALALTGNSSIEEKTMATSTRSLGLNTRMMEDVLVS